MPIYPGRYEPHPTWRETLAAREEALRVRHLKMCERLSEHTKYLIPLKIGDSVRIQNQYGPQPRRWDKTGTIVEVKQFDQYMVRVDGSSNATLRNRKFLRKFIPVVHRQPVYSLSAYRANSGGSQLREPASNDRGATASMPSAQPQQQQRVNHNNNNYVPRVLKCLHTSPGYRNQADVSLPRTRSGRIDP